MLYTKNHSKKAQTISSEQQQQLLAKFAQLQRESQILSNLTPSATAAPVISPLLTPLEQQQQQQLRDHFTRLKQQQQQQELLKKHIEAANLQNIQQQKERELLFGQTAPAASPAASPAAAAVPTSVRPQASQAASPALVSQAALQSATRVPVVTSPTTPAAASSQIKPSEVDIAFAGREKGPIIMPNGDILVNVPPPTQSSKTLNPFYTGGSKINQVGGLMYKLLPGTELYEAAATTYGLKPESEFYEKLRKESEKGNNKVELVPATKSNDAKPHDDNLSPAEQSANNPEVIKNLIRSLDPKIVPDNAKTTKQYEELVKMCDKTTAVVLIKQLLLSKSIPIENLTDERILEILGWNKNTNELLYRNNGQGLFSFFCFDGGSFSPAFSHHCEKNYVCMLNWVLILAFRLRIRDPAKYTDAAIEELIKNMHKALYRFITPESMAKNFTRLDADPNFYTDMSKKNMNTDIFNDVTLTPLVTGIKAQVPQIPDTKNASLSSYFPKKTIDPRVRKTTVKLGGGILHGDSKNSTRKLHRHDRVRPMSHTIKITHKSNSNTKKTVSKRNN